MTLKELQANWREAAVAFRQQAKKCNRRGDHMEAQELAASARDMDSFADALEAHVAREAKYSALEKAARQIAEDNPTLDWPKLRAALQALQELEPK